MPPVLIQGKTGTGEGLVARLVRQMAHIIKVRGRRIHEIEATGTVLPFNSKNGWSDFLR